MTITNQPAHEYHNNCLLNTYAGERYIAKKSLFGRILSKVRDTLFNLISDMPKTCEHQYRSERVGRLLTFHNSIQQLIHSHLQPALSLPQKRLKEVQGELSSNMEQVRNQNKLIVNTEQQIAVQIKLKQQIESKMDSLGQLGKRSEAQSLQKMEHRLPQGSQTLLRNGLTLIQNDLDRLTTSRNDLLTAISTLKKALQEQKKKLQELKDKTQVLQHEETKQKDSYNFTDQLIKNYENAAREIHTLTQNTIFLSLHALSPETRQFLDKNISSIPLFDYYTTPKAIFQL